MSDFALFTDVSLDPVLKFGAGASLLIPAYFLNLSFHDIKSCEISGRLRVQKFEAASSAKLEIETALWALGEYQKASEGKLILYSDSQCISGLLKRKSGLLASDFRSKSTNLPLRNAPLYRSFYSLHDELDLKVIKVKGHSRARDRDTASRIFSIVDREARKALRLWIKELKEAGPDGTAKEKEGKWCVYLLKCRDGSLYTGITNDLGQRLRQHELGKGSKYVRSRMPFELARTIPCKDSGEARRLEYYLKRLSSKEKLVAIIQPELKSS
jgi:ribonuclease HI